MTTTMHFGPEWMRTKHKEASRPQPPPSPPPTASLAPQNASTYSALVSPAPPPEPEKRDETHPFRYSKEEMLRIYKEGGGKGGLGLEVERWEGVVREVGSEPIGLREMDNGEKKLFSGPLNSDLRRRQSTDYLSSLNTSHGVDRPRLNHNSTGSGSPMRERFGSFMGKRRDGTDPPTLTMPRKQSLSSGQGPLASPRDAALPSPRTRMGFGPGFDGVLSSGDSWIARRKAAEGIAKSAGTTQEDAGGESDTKSKETKKEDEEPNIPASKEPEDNFSAEQSSVSQSFNSLSTPNELVQESETQAVNKALIDLSLSNGGQFTSELSPGGSTSISLATGLPPIAQNLQDLANVEWSYLDPQGNVQGPFLASVMQKWYEDGYFAPDLLMRRTHTDNEWIPVGELNRRAGGGKIFLSPLVTPTAPPGLARHSESPLQSFTSPHDQNAFNAPYQPVPMRSLRTSTLDSYIGSSSNPSDSPSSSFGAGRFSNGSPDPAAFGGRMASNVYTDPGMGGRMSGFGGAVPGSSFTASRGFNEPALDPSLGIRGGGFNTVPGRATSVDNYAYNGGYSTQHNQWPLNSTGPGFEGTTTGRPSDPMSPYSSNFAPSAAGFNTTSTQHLNQQGAFVSNRGPHDTVYVDNSMNNAGFTPNGYNGAVGPGNQQQITQPTVDDKLQPNSGTGFANVTNGAGQVTGGVTSQQQYTQSPSLQYRSEMQQPVLALQTKPASSHVDLTPATPQSPWDSVEPVPIRRPGPGPFDASHPKAINTVVNSSATSAQPSPWGPSSQTSKEASQTKEASPWYTASQESPADDDWREAPGPNSLTVDNLGAHNQLQETISEPPISTAEITAQLQPISPIQPAVEPLQPALSELAPTSVPKSKRKDKAAAQQSQTVLLASKTQPPVSHVAKNSSPPPVQNKPAWSTEDDAKKAKPSGTGLGLREIQEAEAKKLEVRKTAERERERAARVISSSSPASDDTQAFIASWGLPTSRAGARNDASPKEGPITSSSTLSTANTPVWTNTGKPQQTKKSMKEIQEEEERRKKVAVKETAASAAARRGYADTTNKIASSAQLGGGAWTTVGATGKQTTASPVTARPAVTAPVPTVNTAGSPSTLRSNGPTSSRPTAAPKPAPMPRVEEPLTTPSHEFLKWLSDSLKGLNSSVNVEDIMSMLLSFPMDPDPSTAEIISEMIYANSTTLDGRRFASEFVSKRKADAASKRGTAATGKPVSIADVVRTQPKPTQPEWGGFKVVNKKKKSGRS